MEKKRRITIAIIVILSLCVSVFALLSYWFSNMRWDSTTYIQTSFSQDDMTRIDTLFDLDVASYGKDVLIQIANNWDTSITTLFFQIKDEYADAFDRAIAAHYDSYPNVTMEDDIETEEGVWHFKERFHHKEVKIYLDRYSSQNGWSMWCMECYTVYSQIEYMMEQKGQQVETPISDRNITAWV